MPSVIDRAARTLRAIDGVVFDATDDTITVPRPPTMASSCGFGWCTTASSWCGTTAGSTTFDRAEDALDCFEYGLSDSCRLKITLRGDEPIVWHVEKREYGMWVPGHHPRKRRSLAFWRPTQRRLPAEPGVQEACRLKRQPSLTISSRSPAPRGQRGVHFGDRRARLAFAAVLFPLAEARLH